MKRTKTILPAVITVLILFTSSLFAQEADNAVEEEKSPFSLELQTDAAYYPDSEKITGGDHFAPITGPYSGLEGCTTLNATYQLDTPLGEHWLVSGANVSFTGALEVTPISIRPKAKVAFTPVPFLIFAGGGSVGLGWNIGSIEGLCELNKTTYDYEYISTFNHPYYDLWASATFQFDTGAIISGDWSHVVILASYKVLYSEIGGLEDYSVYEWQCSKNKAKGLSYEFQGVLGYQMPIVLSLAGVMFKSEGFYDGKVYGEYDKNFDGDFAEISISPLMQFNLGDKDSLTCLFDFSSRRSFAETFEKPGESLTKQATGREWYFKRFALSWTHKFM